VDNTLPIDTQTYTQTDTQALFSPTVLQRQCSGWWVSAEKYTGISYSLKAYYHKYTYYITSPTYAEVDTD